VTTYFQDRYPDNYAHCYGCGRLNQNGWRISSSWDPEHPDQAFAVVKPPAELTGGWAGNLWGGVVAAVLDCHSAGTAAASKARELGLSDQDESPRCVTASLAVDYLKPTPVGVPLRLIAQASSIDGRKIWVDARLEAEGEVCATSRALMIQVV
jgi:acyl-coenzyme A thioesterase PaaI-like protein